MPISNNIQVDVFLSGSSDTSVRTLDGSSQVAVGYGSNDVIVTQGGGQSSSVGQEGQTVNVGMAGIQGPPSSSSIGYGLNNQLQYNRFGFMSGAKTFLYTPENYQAMVSGGIFTLENSSFRITGTHIYTDLFLIKDINDARRELFKIDSEGDIYITGDILPVESGISDLGSDTRPFGDIYLQGDSVNFVDANARISAEPDGFNFFIEESIEGQTEIINVLSILTGIDGSRISGIAEFVGDMTASSLSVPYTGLEDNGIFIEQNIPQNSASVLVNFGESLPYLPKVLCSMVPAEGSNELYFTFVEDVGYSSCKAVFSSKITQNGYKLNCFVSPRDL